MNRIQRAYAQAKARHDAIKAANDQREADYCAAHGYKTGDGKPALHVWMIDDDAIFETANAEFSILNEQSGNDGIEAREALRSAEDALIEWGLSIIPRGMEKERETLRSEGKRLLKVREQLIDLAFKVDSRTVPTLA